MGSNPTSPIHFSDKINSLADSIEYSMSTRAAILFILLTVLSAWVYAGEVETFTGRPSGVIKWVPVEYPPKLRLYGWNGKGLFLLKVNQRTGDVDEVKVLKSTGHALFNEFAAKAFFQWKFQPGSPAQVQVLVEFYARGFSRDLH